MDRALDSLSSDFKPLVISVLARLVERQIPVLIVQTLRTMEEHLANLKKGTSHTSLSKHLPRIMRGYQSGTADDHKCDAIDLCPYELYQIAGPDKLAWNVHANSQTLIAWQAIGELGESHGMRWGGRWTLPHDPGHLEYVAPRHS